MTADDVKRKLSAVFSADVEGYSRLMGEDELATIETLTSHKETMGKLIRQHRGRVVDSTGDNLLAEFASVVDAVQCAVEVQQVLRSKNEALPENRRMHFRIGINLGDVVEEGERIYGDGVNIAARVESLAQGGGISLSGTAYDQLGKKLPLGYEYLGEQTVKNIEKPVRIYRVLTEAEAAGKVIGEKRAKPTPWRWPAVAIAVVILAAGVFSVWNFYLRSDVEPASAEKMAYPLPDKPSIAVLPFDNMSNDPKQEVFCDGITEEIITGLSKVPDLFVIARNSTFTYKGKPVKVQQVAQDLGVRYVLEGSVRKSQRNLRITAQLIDAVKGHHLWADRWDRELTDLFAIQDEITMKITTAMQVNLTAMEQARVVAKGTNNLDAYLKILEANEHMVRFNQESNDLARQLAEEAIELDPQYAFAYVVLGKTHMMDVWLGTSSSPKKSMAKAIELAQKAIDIDESMGRARALLGFLFTLIGKHEKGIMEAEKAVTLEPNSDLAHQYLALALRFGGRANDAIPVIKKAIRLNPFAPSSYVYNLGLSYLFSGQHEEAIAECEKAATREPDNLGAQIALTAAYGFSGRDEKARATALEVLRINPKFSLEHFSKSLVYKDQNEKARFVDALRKAGLPETPPLPLPDKPSIAVLPFVNMSGDPEQEYFSDGIAEEIITALSKTSKLFVIARTSSFKYKSKEVDVRKVGRELGVRYVLEGSVRWSEDRLRITAQLIDAKTGNHVWAQRYDRNLKDIFALQDEITMKIITALQVKLTEGEQARLWGKRIKRLDLLLKQMELRSLWSEGTKEAHIRFGQVAQEVIDMAPESWIGYRAMAWHYWWLAILGKSPRASIGKAFKFAQKAHSMDESDPWTYALLNSVYLLMRQYDKAIAAGKRSIELDPNGAMAHGLLGMTLSYAGRPDEALIYLNQGIRLNPFPEYWNYLHLGRCYMQKGQYEKSLAEFKKGLKAAPGSISCQIGITVIYSLLGREEEARASGKKLLETNPNFSVERLKKQMPYKNQADTKRIVDALHKAGLK